LAGNAFLKTRNAAISVVALSHDVPFVQISFILFVFASFNRLNCWIYVQNELFYFAHLRFCFVSL